MVYQKIGDKLKKELDIIRQALIDDFRLNGEIKPLDFYLIRNDLILKTGASEKEVEKMLEVFFKANLLKEERVIVLDEKTTRDLVTAKMEVNKIVQEEFKKVFG